MAKTQIKICGLQSVKVLKSIYPLDMDLLGFVFAPSRRQVTVEQAQALLNEVRPGVQRVGVFVNPEPSRLEQVLKQLPLTHVQLHGSEPPDFCQMVRERWGVKVIKALSVKEEAPPAEWFDRYHPHVDGWLIDTYSPRGPGGTGERFNWELIPRLQQLVQDKPYWIAGGLTPDNVGELLQRFRPYGVDVSSGVESHGQKDPEKIRAFISKVRTHEHHT